MTDSPLHLASRLKPDTQRERRILALLATIGEIPSQSKPSPKIALRYRSSMSARVLLLEDLNNDVLSIIIDLLSDIDNLLRRGKPFNRRRDAPSHKSLLSLSLTSKRMRAMCIPVLFKDVTRITPSLGELNFRLRDLEGNPLLLKLPSVLPYIK